MGVTHSQALVGPAQSGSGKLSLVDVVLRIFELMVGEMHALGVPTGIGGLSHPSNCNCDLQWRMFYHREDQGLADVVAEPS